MIDQIDNQTSDDQNLRNGIWPRSVPFWMSVFYMALFIIRPWEQLMPWLSAIRFERIYSFLMILTVIVSSKKKIRITFQSFTVIFFLMAISISMLFAWKPSLAKDVFIDYRNMIIFYFILFFVIRSSYELYFIIICYIFIMMVYLAKAQWEFFVHGAHRYDMGVVRLVGIEDSYGGPNDLAMSINVTLPFLLFLWNNKNEIVIRWSKNYKKWFSRFLIVYAGLALTSIILTNSRSGMLGFVLFIILVTFKGKGFFKKIAYILLGGLTLAVIWQFVPEENQNRFRTIWDKDAGPQNATVSAEGRIQGYKAGMAMFKRYPITGVGIGNFVEYRVTYLDGIALQAHNLAGQALGETGIIGGSTFLLMIAVIFYNVSKSRKLSKYYTDKSIQTLLELSVSIRNSLIILFFLGLFGHNLDRYNWLWLAIFANLVVIFIKERNKAIYSINEE